MDIALNGGLPGFTLETLVGQSVAILGVKGSGKSTTAAVILEELYGHIPLIIVDIESEYWSLKEQFELLVVGRSPNVDVEMQPDQSEDLARFVLENNLSVVLDVSEFNETERERFLVNFFQSLWNAAFTARKPFQIVLEEAHEFVLQGARSELKTILTRIALRGRKRGLGLIVVSQRSAKVEKDVLTQAGVVFLHSVRHPVDIKVYQDIIPLPPKQVEQMIAELKTGQAIVLYGQEIRIATIRQRYTFHAGYTPGISQEAPPLKTIDATLLARLSETLRESTDDDGSEDVEALRRQVDHWKKIAQQKTAGDPNPELVAEVEGLRQQYGAAVIQHRRDREAWKQETERQLAEQAARYEAQLKSLPPTKTSAPSKIVAVSQVERPPITESGLNAQKRAFNALIADIKKLPHLHQMMLRYLAERDTQEYSINELSRYMGRAVNTLVNSPPTLLLSKGLLERVGRGANGVYRSNLHSVIRQRFPDLNSDECIERLIRVLPGA